MGVARNDVTVNNKGGPTCNNGQQLLQASSLVIYILPNYSLKSHGSGVKPEYTHKSP